MKVSEAYESRFLRASDIEEPTEFTIRKVKSEMIGDQEKIVVYFREVQKPLVLNVTNAKSIAKVTGEDDTDDWIDQKVTLYVQEVSFKGETVDAIRVKTKADKKKSKPTVDDEEEEAPPKKKKVASEDNDDDEPPF